jgi:hypothetical protein
MNIKRLFEALCKLAERNIKRAGMLVPIFLLYSRDGTLMPMVVAWNSDEERDRALTLVRLACIAHDVNVLSWVHEAWSLRMMPGDEFVQPRNSERRVEVACVTLAAFNDATGEMQHMSRAREILRDAAGKVTGLKPPQPRRERMETQSILLDLLPPRRLAPAEIENAKLLLAMAPGVEKVPFRSDA